jgi:hypothetical protein
MSWTSPWLTSIRSGETLAARAGDGQPRLLVVDVERADGEALGAAALHQRAGAADVVGHRLMVKALVMVVPRGPVLAFADARRR